MIETVCKNWINGITFNCVQMNEVLNRIINVNNSWHDLTECK